MGRDERQQDGLERGGDLAALRRRMERRGARALEDHELLALLLGLPSSATAPGLRELERVGAAEAADLLGVGPARRGRLAAILEIARRLPQRRRGARPRFTSSREVFEYVQLELRSERREVFEILALDARHALLRRERVSVGTLTGSLVHPREVFRPALAVSAAAVVLLHNHPSGDPAPSREDLEVTRRLSAAGRILGVEILDHVIVGEGRWVSLAEMGALCAPAEDGERKRAAEPSSDARRARRGERGS